VNVSRQADSWGPYRATMEDHLANCADYLSRLERSVAGTIAPDRYYFNDKARQLLLAARDLVRRGQDIERWVNGCGTTMDRAHDVQVSRARCELPAGHAGDHDDDPPTAPAEQACANARDLADLSDLVAHRLRWLAPTLDQRAATGAGPADDDRESLRDAAATLERVAHDAQKLASRLRSIEPSHDQNATTSGAGLPRRQYGGAPQHGALGL
jgi:hypothetical protein